LSFQLGNRDEHGFLVGRFDQGWGSFPIEVIRRIVPFLYPCQECRGIQFHVVGEQHAGIAIKIPFMKKPLASTGKGHQAICNTCTTINTVLPIDVVRKLEAGIIAPQLCGMYATFCDAPEPYTEGFAAQFVERRPEVAKNILLFVKKCLEAYRREAQPV
jgi:hypothetical protein